MSVGRIGRGDQNGEEKEIVSTLAWAENNEEKERERETKKGLLCRKKSFFLLLCRHRSSGGRCTSADTGERNHCPSRKGKRFFALNLPPPPTKKLWIAFLLYIHFHPPSPPPLPPLSSRLRFAIHPSRFTSSSFSLSFRIWEKLPNSHLINSPFSSAAAAELSCVSHIFEGGPKTEVKEVPLFPPLAPSGIVTSITLPKKKGGGGGGREDHEIHSTLISPPPQPVLPTGIFYGRKPGTLEVRTTVHSVCKTFIFILEFFNFFGLYYLPCKGWHISLPESW